MKYQANKTIPNLDLRDSKFNGFFSMYLFYIESDGKGECQYNGERDGLIIGGLTRLITHNLIRGRP